MTVNISALAGAGQQFFDNNGIILSGGKLYSYAAGTTTPQTTYTSAAGNTAHTNPIILDSAGRVPTGEIWLTAGSNYKFVLTTSADVSLVTWDNITGINGTGITTNASSVQYDPVNDASTTVAAFLDFFIGHGGNGELTNTRVGEDALSTNTTGTNNTAVGKKAMELNTTGYQNTAVGVDAMFQNTTGHYNTSVGEGSMMENTTGTDNTAIGHSSYKFSTTGSYNTALGKAAMHDGGSGNSNTAVGYRSNYYADTGAANVMVGAQSGEYTNTGSNNTFIGYQAGLANTTSSNNTFVGSNAGEVIDTGTGNTVIGKYTGNQGGYDIRNANNHVVLADGAGNVRALFNQDGQMRIPSGVCFGTLQALTGSSTVNETAYYVLMYSLSGTATLTLVPRVGRILKIVNHSSELIQSASSNIAAIVNGALGTQILPGTPGKWVELWCDGTNWNIIAAN